MRQWSVPVLGVAAALLFGYVATHRVPVDRPRPPAAGTPAPTGLPEVTGDRGAGPAGLRVLVDGRHPVLVDAGSGRTTAIGGLSLGARDRVRLRIAPAGVVATVTGPGRSRTRSALLSGRAPVRLGEDVDVVPARRGTDLYVSAPGPADTTVRMLDRAGGLRASWRRPGRLTVLRDTAAGLVVSEVGAVQGTELWLLDPRTGAERRRLATGRIVVAVGPVAVAHVSGSCAAACPVTVTRLADGRSRDHAGPGGTPGSGAFSPDGRWLALAVPGQYRDGRLTVVPGFAAVLDLRTGAVTPVPGVRTAAERQPDVSWSGGLLVLGVWGPERGRLAVWTPGRPGPVTVLPVQPAGDDRFSSATALP